MLCLLALLALTALALLAPGAAADDARFLVLPPPRSIAAAGAPRALAPDFAFTLAGAGAQSPLLLAAAAREAAHFRASLAAAAAAAPLPRQAGQLPALLGAELAVASAAEALSARTDVSYTLAAAPGDARVRIAAQTVFGALAGLASLRQLLARGGGGALPHAALRLDDAPAWPHRGIMLDAGRRFFPVPLVQNIIDTMALLKMSLLHLHVSDECRFAIESKLFPNLTARLVGDYGGFYSQDDIKALVAYGLARGVRIMLEMDIPGHSRGLLPLAGYGAVFCDPQDATCSQMFGDPANKTYDVLTALLGEMVPLFPEEVVHIGADETGVVGVCTTQSTFAVERLVLEYLQGTLGKTPAGWEEVLFDANAATPQTVVYSWSRHNPVEVAARGYGVVNNNASHFYTTRPGGAYPASWANFYFDIAQGLNATGRQLLQGGEISQWTDTYCITSQCGASNGATPYAAALFPPSQDAAFGASIGGMLFPRGIVAASAFWGFNASVDSQDPAFVAAVWAVNDQIAAAGGVTCPSRCECDQLNQCGKPLVPPTPPAANFTVGLAPCALPVPPLQAFARDAASGALLAAGAGGAMLCVANPAGGSGNPTYPLRLAPAGAADCVAWAHGAAVPAGRMVDGASGGCLDAGQGAPGGSVGIYDCGSDSGLYQLNQAWAADAGLGAVVNLKEGMCLTAVA